VRFRVPGHAGSVTDSHKKGFDAITLEELAYEADVSKTTFRFFPAKEVAAIETETEP
jgi:AcrR family transcriptional regulator